MIFTDHKENVTSQDTSGKGPYFIFCLKSKTIFLKKIICVFPNKTRNIICQCNFAQKHPFGTLKIINMVNSAL